jgi:hypothetical protein
MSFAFLDWIVLTLGTLSFFATVIGLSVWIAALIAREALKKGKSWEQFFWLALFFPLVIFIIVTVMSSDESKAGTKTCPKCAELVKIQAALCKHCGSSI